MMHLFFVRHGETEGNINNLKQGSFDTPLTEKGVWQARCIAGILLDKPIDIIMTSPIGRSLATANIITESTGIKVKVIEDLREYDFGRWSGMTKEEIKRRFPEEIKKRREDRFNYRIVGGESYRDVLARSKRFIDKLLKSRYSNVLITSHEICGRTMIGYILKMAMSEIMKIRHPNDIIYEVNSEPASVRYIDLEGKFCDGLLRR